jgi:hypothetical protein
MGALMGLLSSKGGAAGSAMDYTKGGGGMPQVAPGVMQMAPGLQGPTMGAQDAVAAGLGQSGAPGSGWGSGTSFPTSPAGPPPQVAPGIIQMAPGLAGPTMGMADAVNAGLGQSGAPGGMAGLLQHLTGQGQQQQDGQANSFMKILSGFSPHTRAILQMMQRGQRKPLGGLGTQ